MDIKIDISKVTDEICLEQIYDNLVKHLKHKNIKLLCPNTNQQCSYCFETCSPLNECLQCRCPICPNSTNKPKILIQF